MAQLADEAAAVDAPVEQTDSAPATNALYPDDQPENETPVDEAGEGEGEVEADPDAERDVEADEPEAPAIDAPVSFNKEAKEHFSKLPPEMQTFVAEQEAHRNRQVQEATTRAAEAQRQAQADVAQQVAQGQSVYAQQVGQIAQAYAPKEPKPWEYQDQATYSQAMQQFEQASAQHQQLVQHATEMRAQADQQMEQHQQAYVVQDARRVMADLPELGDQTAYSQLVQELTPIAKELGYPEDRISQALPSDVLAMKRVAAFKAKADKWDQLQARRMEQVRAGKAAPQRQLSKPGAAGVAAKTANVPLAKQLYPND